MPSNIRAIPHLVEVAPDSEEVEAEFAEDEVADNPPLIETEALR